MCYTVVPLLQTFNTHTQKYKQQQIKHETKEREDEKELKMYPSYCNAGCQ